MSDRVFIRRRGSVSEWSHHRAALDGPCIACGRRDAVKAGDRRLKRTHDVAPQVCLDCEPDFVRRFAIPSPPGPEDT